MKSKFVLFLLVILFSASLKSQELSIPIKISHKHKIRTIESDSFSLFRVCLSYDSISDKIIERSFEGRVLDYDDKHILLSPFRESNYINYNCDSIFSYEKIFMSSGNSIRIDLKDILKIEKKGYTAGVWESFGIGSIVVGSFTTLVLAPLISIDYKNGEFNSSRYFKTAAVGLGFVTIGIPLTILTKKKTYYFKRKENGKATKIWKVKH